MTRYFLILKAIFFFLTPPYYILNLKQLFPGVDIAMALKAKAIDALKGGAEKKQIKLNLKNPVGVRKPDVADVRKSETGAAAQVAKKRPASSPPPIDPKNASSNKKATSRREELLKQLKAVEDAIAKKRSKVN